MERIDKKHRAHSRIGKAKVIGMGCQVIDIAIQFKAPIWLAVQRRIDHVGCPLILLLMILWVLNDSLGIDLITKPPVQTLDAVIVTVQAIYLRAG